MKFLKVLFSLLPMNGQKFNTGTIVFVAGFLIQHFLGVTEGVATEIVANIMLGVGGVYALVGYIHKLIKAKEGKKDKPAVVEKK